MCGVTTHWRLEEEENGTSPFCKDITVNELMNPFHSDGSMWTSGWAAVSGAAKASNQQWEHFQALKVNISIFVCCVTGL